MRRGYEVMPSELVGLMIREADFNDDGELVFRCEDKFGVHHSYIEEGGLLYHVEERR
ncbi:hypothetical protein JK151_20685 (plasmid) [Ralstonia syzygii subsp. celebesensis]|uniref:Uncharacterized protein n=1 Tax=blood disease bacterium R229 TaxID=741978 RepID=G2ZVY7_9RALS|nr:hypothetical protein [Ralstonia syzygii]QQV57844.1 hypothetical protein JK151_20685 [Ralstonia syzygii subsp. celebesensis]CCA83268.1 hypothetical protein BDB_mp60434 [blood disease bacterium R229]